MFLYNILSFPFILIAFIYILRLRGSFFRGYLTEYDISTRGPLLTASLSIFSLAIIKTINSRSFKNWQMLLYWGIAFFVLTMGTRLYFLSSLLTSFAIYFTYQKKIRKIRFFILAVLIILVFSSIGVIRQGNILDNENIIFVFFGEPFYTSYSLFSSLKFNQLPLLNFPKELLISFINLIPTGIFANKVEIMGKMSVSEYSYVSPLGAKNIFVSLMENFGILGSFVFIGILAFFITLISKKIRPSYFFIMGILCFSFFRDPFSVSIVKYIIQLSLFVPLYYYCGARFFMISMSAKK
jgi:hypothetical protein